MFEKFKLNVGIKINKPKFNLNLKNLFGNTDISMKMNIDLSFMKNYDFNIDLGKIKYFVDLKPPICSES